MAKYSMHKQLTTPFETAVIKVREALAGEGFGVVTQIDMRSTFKQKLDINYLNYLILGACHPASAYEALQSDQEIGLLLPCNVIVYESAGTVHVSIIRPTVFLQIADASMEELAKSVEAKLKRVLEAL